MKPRCYHLVFGLVVFSMAWLAFVDSASADLVAYWPLDGDATATVGTSGTLIDGPIAAADRNGLPGGALAFDGISQYVEVPGGGGIDGMYVGTISMWVNWSGVQDADCCGGTFGSVLARQEDGVFSNNVVSLSGNDPATAGVTWRSSGAGIPPIIGTTAVGDGTWRHIAVTFQPDIVGGCELFVDGVSQGTGLGDALSISPITPLAIGAWSAAGSGYSTSRIDDVAVFDDLLSPTQIGELAAQTKTPLDVGSGTTPAPLPIRGVVATASTELIEGFNRIAANTTDGVGRTTIIPNGNAGQIDGMWLSNGTFRQPNDTDPEITFDLGELFYVDEMVLYNYNEWHASVDLLTRGVNEVDIYTSGDGVTFDWLSTESFAKGTGDANNPGQSVLLGGLEARYIKLDILSNHGDTNQFAGLNEVDFYGRVVPEPSTLSLLFCATLGLLVLGARRRRRAA
ncbi:MAG: hypothetical protein A2V70_05760 [Planctomycetes bacterium RBG_13_63_9]|nr:MAG: hypothetical protein A2V70_05760 [Planctomycetes bacterium RBG_13_63_9]